MEADRWRRCVRLSVTEGALATAMATLLSGVFLTGLALSLGASRLIVGILAAIPSLANVAQLVGAKRLNSGVDRKRFCVRCLAASRLIWLAVLAGAVLIPNAAVWLLPTLIGVVAISSVLSSMGGIAWLSWIRDLVPAPKRLGFLALRNQFDTVLALSLSIAGALFIDWWRANHFELISGFLCVLFAAIVCGLIGIPILGRVDDAAASDGDPSKCVPMFRLPLGERNFRTLVLFYVVWNLACNVAAPFYVVFMIDNACLPFWHIVALQTLFSLFALFANRFWTSLGERLGTRNVVFLATLGDAFYPLCWVFITADSIWALPLTCLFGVFNTPLAVGAPTLVMRLAPDSHASSYLATFNATMGLVMGLAAIGGGFLAMNFPQLHSSGDTSLVGLKVVFVISFLGRLASLPVLYRVTEPGAIRVSKALPSLPSRLSA